MSPIAKALLIAGVVGGGYWLLRKQQAASAPAAPVASAGLHTTSGATIKADFSSNDYLGQVPVIGVAYRFLKPAQKPIQSGLAKVNKAIGGVNPYGDWTPNGDGTYTDGSGCKITPKADGTYTRDCGGWDKNFKNPTVTTIIASGGLVEVGHWIGL